MSKDSGGPDSDRELLELAAKAAGVELKWSSEPDMPPRIAQTWHNWNPLTDDGDALRLAVSIPGLNLQWIIAEAWQAHEDQASRMKYVRGAIVRAAAAIGSVM